MNFVEQVEACAGQILTLSDVVFVKSNLAQGRVQVVMQWKYVCADGNATCEEPQSLFLYADCISEECERTQ
jgi:hypothetical protein